MCSSDLYTAPAVVVYFLLNSAFTYWMWFVEKGLVYEGEGKTGKVSYEPPGDINCTTHPRPNTSATFRRPQEPALLTPP